MGLAEEIPSRQKDLGTCCVPSTPGSWDAWRRLPACSHHVPSWGTTAPLPSAAEPGLCLGRAGTEVCLPQKIAHVSDVLQGCEHTR